MRLHFVLVPVVFPAVSRHETMAAMTNCEEAWADALAAVASVQVEETYFGSAFVPSYETLVHSILQLAAEPDSYAVLVPTHSTFIYERTTLRNVAGRLGQLSIIPAQLDVWGSAAEPVMFPSPEALIVPEYPYFMRDSEGLVVVGLAHLQKMLQTVAGAVEWSQVGSFGNLIQFLCWQHDPAQCNRLDGMWKGHVGAPRAAPIEPTLAQPWASFRFTHAADVYYDEHGYRPAARLVQAAQAVNGLHHLTGSFGLLG